MLVFSLVESLAAVYAERFLNGMFAAAVTPVAAAAIGNFTGVFVPKLLVLTFIVSAGVGVFEIGLALRGKQELPDVFRFNPATIPLVKENPCSSTF